MVPVVGDGKVFAIGTGGHVYALDAKSGKKLWQLEPSEGRKEKAKLIEEKRTHGAILNLNCPTYVDGKVIVRRGASVVAYAAADGKQVWSLSPIIKTFRGSSGISVCRRRPLFGATAASLHTSGRHSH